MVCPFYLKPVVVAAYELLIELDDGFDKRDGMNQLRPFLCWLQVVYVMFGYTPMPQLFCWVVFSTLDIRFWASPLVGFCMYALVEALSMYQSFLVHDIRPTVIRPSPVVSFICFCDCGCAG